MRDAAEVREAAGVRKTRPASLDRANRKTKEEIQAASRSKD